MAARGQDPAILEGSWLFCPSQAGWVTAMLVLPGGRCHESGLGDAAEKRARILWVIRAPGLRLGQRQQERGKVPLLLDAKPTFKTSPDDVFIFFNRPLLFECRELQGRKALGHDLPIQKNPVAIIKKERHF